MASDSCFNSKATLKISQAEGLRDPKYSMGVALSPSALLRRLGMSLGCRRALPGETEVLGVFSSH